MRSALPNHDPFDLRPTNTAWFACSLVHAEIVLKVSSPVNPVNTGSIAADTFFEYPSDGTQQALRL